MRVTGNIKEMTVSQTQLAKAIGVSTPRVNQLIDEGVVVRDELATNGQVMLFDSLQNYFLAKHTTGEGVSFWKERSLHEKAKRETAELKLSKARSEVYEAATVEGVLVELLTNFRNKLLGIPTKYATRIEGKSRAEIYDMLTEAIEQELTELSEGVKTCDFDENGQDVDANIAERAEADA